MGGEEGKKKQHKKKLRNAKGAGGGAINKIGFVC